MPSLNTIRAEILTTIIARDTPLMTRVLGPVGANRNVYAHGGRLRASKDLMYLIRRTPACIVAPLGWGETRWQANQLQILVEWAIYYVTHARIASPVPSANATRARDVEALDLTVPLMHMVTEAGFIAQAFENQTRWTNLFVVDNDQKQALSFHALTWKSWACLDEDPDEPVYDKFLTLFTDLEHGPLTDTDLVELPQ